MYILTFKHNIISLLFELQEFKTWLDIFLGGRGTLQLTTVSYPIWKQFKCRENLLERKLSDVMLAIN